MRSAFLILAAVLAGSPLQPARAAATSQLDGWTHRPVGEAATPPMGWNSWNAFGVDLSEAKVIGSAQVLLDSGLAALGYRSINLDDGWWLKRRTSDGRLQVRTRVFPSAAVGGAAGASLRRAHRPAARHGAEGGDIHRHRPQHLLAGLCFEQPQPAGGL